MTSARDLTARLAELLRSERASLAEFLVTLADLDRQRGWVELGYASLFNYLHQELELSKGAAFQRMTAAQLIQKYPEVVEPLRDGRLCLSTLTEVSKVITPENRGEVLARYARLSKREATAVTAELRPCEAVPHRVVVTAVRAPVAASALPLPASRAEPLVHPDELTSSSNATSLPERPPPPPSPARTEAVPLTAELSRMHVTVSRRFLAKLEAARAALSHSHPGASEEELLEAGLDLLLERHAKRRGLVSRPRQEPRPAQPEHVPAHVKRAVWKPRRRGVPMAPPRRRRLRLHAPGRARPHRPESERRPLDGREHEARLPVPQRPRRAAGLRRRLDGQVHPGRREAVTRGGDLATVRRTADWDWNAGRRVSRSRRDASRARGRLGRSLLAPGRWAEPLPRTAPAPFRCAVEM